MAPAKLPAHVLKSSGPLSYGFLSLEISMVFFYKVFFLFIFFSMPVFLSVIDSKKLACNKSIKVTASE